MIRVITLFLISPTIYANELLRSHIGFEKVSQGWLSIILSIVSGYFAVKLFQKIRKLPEEDFLFKKNMGKFVLILAVFSIWGCQIVMGQSNIYIGSVFEMLYEYYFVLK